jgi:hypothetical protein
MTKIQSFFKVHRILQKRQFGKSLKLLVKWVGYKIPTWEPVKELRHTKAYQLFTGKLFKTYSSKVPMPSRRMVWKTYFGDVWKHPCFCCNKVMLEALGAWHRAHVKSKSTGGSDNLKNLRPICAQCNCEMRTSNLYKFKKHNFSKNNSK